MATSKVWRLSLTLPIGKSDYTKLLLLISSYYPPLLSSRTFVILSLRAGIDPLHLQALLGHAKLDMVMYYAQMVDDDLLQAHKVYSPIDNLSRLK